MIAYNQYGTPVLGYISISAVQLEGEKFVETDAHHFYYDNDHTPSGWVWQKYNQEHQLMSEVKLASMTEVLSAFVYNTKMPEQIAIVLEIIDNPNADKLSSICTGDFLRLIGPYLENTRIELVSYEGESYGAPRFLRWGPSLDSDGNQISAFHIPLFTDDMIDGPIEPLLCNVAMTDWHEEADIWHVWEILYKSGDVYSLVQAEIGYDDKVSIAVSEDKIPLELLTLCTSLELSQDPNDPHLVDKWGRLLILDRGRELLPQLG